MRDLLASAHSCDGAGEQRFGRGFGAVNLSQMKRFYLLWPSERILQTPSEKLGDAEKTPRKALEIARKRQKEVKPENTSRND